jgi:hypothetical protein
MCPALFIFLPSTKTYAFSFLHGIYCFCYESGILQSIPVGGTNACFQIDGCQQGSCNG